jgi:hypothetical protein
LQSNNNYNAKQYKKTGTTRIQCHQDNATAWLADARGNNACNTDLAVRTKSGARADLPLSSLSASSPVSAGGAPISCSHHGIDHLGQTGRNVSFEYPDTLVASNIDNQIFNVLTLAYV